MAIKKATGNMYPPEICTHLWKPILGKCPHQCSYCSIGVINHRYGNEWRAQRLDEKCFTDIFDKAKRVFVANSTDMFAKAVPEEWILRVFNYCLKFEATSFLYQTKNPARLLKYIDLIKNNDVLACTFESNREHQVSQAPKISDRFDAFEKKLPCKKMITIEPVLDFDSEIFLALLCKMAPDQIAIGADSKKCRLPEPSKEKLESLLAEMEKRFKVIRKDNLERLLK